MKCRIDPGQAVISLCLAVVICLGAFAAEPSPIVLRAEATTNSIFLDSIPQASSAELEKDTDYSLEYRGTVINGKSPVPVILVRGDADSGLAWECMYDGHRSLFNSSTVLKVMAFFAHVNPAGNSGTGVITITKGGAEIARLELDGRKNCVDLSLCPCASTGDERPGPGYRTTVAGNAAVGGVPLPLLLVWDRGPFTFWRFVSAGEEGTCGEGATSPVRALFVGFSSRGMRGGAVVTFSPPAGER